MTDLYNTPFNTSSDPTLSEEMRFLVVQIKEHVARINDPDLATDKFLTLMQDQMLDLMDRAKQNEIASAQMTRMLGQIRSIMCKEMINLRSLSFDLVEILNLINANEREGLAA